MSNDDTVASTSCKKTKNKGHDTVNLEHSALKHPKEMEKKSKLKDSFSSVGSKSKAETTTTFDKEKKSTTKLTKDKKVMESLHASYGSLGTGSFSSLKNMESEDESDEEFVTPRQSLTSPSKCSWKNKIHQKNNPLGSPAQRKIMAPPISPLSAQTSHHHEWVTNIAKTNHEDSSIHDSSSSLSNSASYEEFSTPRQSPWKTRQRKKTITPNSKDQTHIKTIFLEDCSDSSDSDQAKRKIRPKAPKKEKRKVLKNKNEGKKATKNCLSNHEERKLTKSKSRKMVYSKQHINAANRIAALVRGHIERMKNKMKKLQYQLDNMEVKTISEIADIYLEYEILKGEWYEKAHNRYQKNLHRLDRSLTVSEAHNLIQKIRAENADFRERNRMLLEDVQKLKINNERLEAANRASNEFMDRIVYHEDSCSAEHIKLLKVHSKYKKAIKEHEEHLALYVAFGECENNAKTKYNHLLQTTLELLEFYKETDSQFVVQINKIACQVGIF
jgi:hypothetical protein